MRHRIDAGSGLVAVGAAVLLVSLFLDWYEPDLNAWTSFEVVDVALASLAVAALVGAAGPPGPGTAMVRWGPLVSLAAFILVASQLIDPPPGVEADRQAGAWMALAAALAMGVGSALAVATISVTVDVQGRDRRRAVAVDRRETGEEAGDEEGAADRRRVPDRGGRDDGEEAVARRWEKGAEAVTDRPTQAFEALERPPRDDADTTAAEGGDGADEGSHGAPAPRDPPPRG